MVAEDSREFKGMLSTGGCDLVKEQNSHLTRITFNKRKRKARLRNNMKSIPLRLYQILNELALYQGDLCKEKYDFAILLLQTGIQFFVHNPVAIEMFSCTIVTFKYEERVRDTDRCEYAETKRLLPWGRGSIHMLPKKVTL